MRFDRIVPISVKGVWSETDGGHLFVANSDFRWVPTTIEDAAHGQARGGSSVGDELDDRGMGKEWLATPVLADEREESMLDLVPFARAGRQVGDMNREACG